MAPLRIDENRLHTKSNSRINKTILKIILFVFKNWEQDWTLSRVPILSTELLCLRTVTSVEIPSDISTQNFNDASIVDCHSVTQHVLVFSFEMNKSLQKIPRFERFKSARGDFKSNLNARNIATCTLLFSHCHHLYLQPTKLHSLSLD